MRLAALVIPAAALSAFAAPAAPAQSPPARAAQGAAQYVVLNHGRPAGEMVVTQAGDSVLVHYHHVDRNRGPRVESRYRIGPDGRLVEGRSWTLPLDQPDAPRGEPADRFEVVRDSVFYAVRGASPQRVRPEAGAVYRLRGGTTWEQAALARYLLGRRDRTAALVPAGTLRAEVVADTVVGAGRQRARLVALHGGGVNPQAVWLDERGELLASEVGWFITVRRGLEDVLPALRRVEIAFRNRRGEELAKRTVQINANAAATAIVNADLFDSERGVVLPRRTVVVRGDRIVAVGPADSVRVPAGAMVYDAAGKTVVPGLWDMHTHFQLTSQTGTAIQHLAAGVTTIRDLAADVDVAVQHRDRAAAGTIVAPRAILAGFIEGPGRWAGPSEAIARDEAEAVAWVARYDTLGYRQIKLYNLVHPDFVPAIAAEAHRRGMRLSGHVPRGLTVPAALRLGLDEINHAAFLFSTFFQDSLYVPQMRAYSAVAAAVAPNVDVDGPAMTALIADLKARGTVVDGTFALWLRGPAPGQPPRPNVGVPAARDSAEAARSDASYLRLAKRLFDAGVTLVPGTDGGPYNVELETYERAGIPAADVLRMATIVSARVMRDDREYGSIAPGKVADLIVVAGRPAERVADLRKIERVMRAGRLYETRALGQAALAQTSGSRE